MRPAPALLSLLDINNPNDRKNTMNRLLAHITSRGFAAVASAVIACASLFSCDSAIYDNEGDCTINHYVRFVYDYNMLNADAFPGNVKSVDLYAFDPETHILVKHWSEKSPEMAEQGWKMKLDVTPGKTYDLLAWCGIETDPASFRLPAATVGSTTREQLTCELMQSAPGIIDNNHPISPMWHGTLDDVTFTDADGAEQVETIRLTKDTNTFIVALQNLSGKPIQEGLFEFTITDNNGLLSADNIPFSDNPQITIYPYHTTLATAVYDPSIFYGDGSDNTTQALRDADPQGSKCVAIAELSSSRLMVGSKATITVRRTDTGTKLFELPLIDLALCIKGYQNRAMSDQEFLDRQDSFNMTFFLDDNHHWAGAVIIINSWRVVYQPAVFGK